MNRRLSLMIQNDVAVLRHLSLTINDHNSPTPMNETQAHCPRCGKEFANHTNVLKHMNQPISKCRFYYENAAHFHEPSNIPTTFANQSMATMDQDFSRAEEYEEYHTPLTTQPDAMDIDTTNLPPPSSSSKAMPYFQENHSAASHIFGQGKTFMDGFYEDQFSEYRKENLYYPFASDKEWELALFLLRSGLSMASIDQFLKLELVCLVCFIEHVLCLLIQYRFSNFTSL